jgi:hypothetical protein
MAMFEACVFFMVLGAVNLVVFLSRANKFIPAWAVWQSQKNIFFKTPAIALHFGH